MPPDFLDEVQNKCGQMMDTFGYHKFLNEKEMFDSSKPPMKDKKEIPFLLYF
jgi:hypothetical protein